MKLIKNTIISTILSLILSCCEIPNHTSPRYVKLSDEVLYQTAQQLEKEKDLLAIGTGGQMMGDIQLARISFQYFHLVNLEESRELLTYAIQTFLKNINENKKIRPYLHTYPFTTKNIEVTIWIYQADGKYPPQGNIQCLELENGILKYELLAPTKFADWPILHEETYEEALKILDENP